MASKPKAEGTFLTGVNIETGHPPPEGGQVVALAGESSSGTVRSSKS